MKNTQRSTIVNQAQFNRLVALVEDAKQQGAKVVHGGTWDAHTLRMAPTLLADVHMDMNIMKEEIFGPVQSILKFETMDELIERVNDTSYGLAAGILTSNLNNALVFTQVGMETVR